jgi:hypothetical protein
MRFQLAHKLVTYLLVLATMAALEAAGVLSLGSLTFFLGAAALSFAVDPGGRMAAALDRSARAVRVVVLAISAVLLWRVWRGLADPDYGPGFDLGLALLAYKLFHRRTHRDYVQVLAFSFVLVLVAATLTASFLFVVAFAVYVGLGIWTLILFHLRREMEENYLVKHSAQAPSQKVGVQRILGSRRVVGPAFFAATALVAAAVCAGGLVVFMFVPRFGAGFVLGGGPLGASALATGEEMTIGRYGTAAVARHRVVLRATLSNMGELPDEAARARAADGLYFRGAVYDTYDRGRWSRARPAALATLILEHDSAETRRFSVHEPANDPQDDRSLERVARQEIDAAVRQEIETVRMPASILFAIDHAVAFELPAPRLGVAGALRVVPGWSGEAALRVGAGPPGAAPMLADAHYVAYSLPRPASTGPWPPGTGTVGRTLAPSARAAALALPAGLAAGLDPIVDELLAGLPPDTDARGRIEATVGWLRARHGYTHESPPAPPGVDPAEAFVRGREKGHCELFASSAVLLLRAAGIPARYVTGFRGGEWNPLGGYVAVRDDRAHAWAEAFSPQDGWIRVDATPPGLAPPPAGRLRQIVDALDYGWSRWMIGYDLPRQRELAKQAGRHLLPAAIPGGATPLRTAGMILLGLAVGALVVAGVRLRWRRRPGEDERRTSPTGPRLWPRRGPWSTTPPLAGGIGRLYARTSARLERAGWPRQPSETPREYARRLRARGLYPAGELELLADRYAAARFGNEVVGEEIVEDLAAKLAEAAPTAGHPGIRV